MINTFHFVLLLKAMKKLVLIVLFIQNTLAVDVVDKYMALKDMEHKNKGCPINSDCSKQMGKRIQKWEKLLAKSDRKNFNKLLKDYLKTDGLPILFLTTKESKIALDPVLHSSRCKQHNPKNPNNNIMKGMAFFKSAPKSKHVTFTSVRVYDEDQKRDYYIPYQDQVILMKNNELIVLKDYDDTYFQMGVSPTGAYAIHNLSYNVIQKALEKKIKETKCPEKMKVNTPYFSKNYCQKIYDLDTNTLKTIQYSWSCP